MVTEYLLISIAIMSRSGTLEKLKDMDLYGLLEISESATKENVTKAYRKKALQCHPDKHPDNPKAVEMFHLLTQALEILTDVAARSAYDRCRKAKKAAEERNQHLDAKRRKLKEDLEAREGKTQAFFGKPSQPAASEPDKHMTQLEREIQRLRKEGNKWVEAEQERLREELRQQAAGSPSLVASAAPTVGFRLRVQWSVSKNDSTNSGITQEFLSTLFSQYGNLNYAAISPKRLGSAVIEFRTKSGADKAFLAENGRMFRLSWIADAAPRAEVRTNVKDERKEKQARTPTPLQTSHEEFEAMVLARMAVAAAAKRKQMERM